MYINTYAYTYIYIYIPIYVRVVPRVFWGAHRHIYLMCTSVNLKD